MDVTPDTIGGAPETSYVNATYAAFAMGCSTPSPSPPAETKSSKVRPSFVTRTRHTVDTQGDPSSEQVTPIPGHGGETHSISSYPIQRMVLAAHPLDHSYPTPVPFVKIFGQLKAQRRCAPG